MQFDMIFHTKAAFSFIKYAGLAGAGSFCVHNYLQFQVWSRGIKPRAEHEIVQNLGQGGPQRQCRLSAPGGELREQGRRTIQYDEWMRGKIYHSINVFWTGKTLSRFGYFRIEMNSFPTKLQQCAVCRVREERRGLSNRKMTAESWTKYVMKFQINAHI